MPGQPGDADSATGIARRRLDPDALKRPLTRRYDFVFLDSPPIMGVSDASILSSEVDAVMQVIQYRRYPQPMTIRAKHLDK